MLSLDLIISPTFLNTLFYVMLAIFMLLPILLSDLPNWVCNVHYLNLINYWMFKWPLVNQNHHYEKNGCKYELQIWSNRTLCSKIYANVMDNERKRKQYQWYHHSVIPPFPGYVYSLDMRAFSILDRHTDNKSSVSILIVHKWLVVVSHLCVCYTRKSQRGHFEMSL